MRIPFRRTGVPALLCVLACALVPACSPGSRSSSPASPSPAASSSAASSPAASSSSSPAPPPSAAPTTPDGLDARVDAVLAGLDRGAQVAQLFVVGVPLSDLSSGTAPARDGVGGLFLAGRSTAAAADLAAVTAGWTAPGPRPAPWVAADQEGGQVQTLTGPGFERLPSALAQGALPPGELARVADTLGASLHSAGLTLDLAPVADVVPAGTEAGNGPIGAHDRQYGSTAAAVVAAAGVVVDGLDAHSVTATLKHFPGLGRVRGNTDDSTDVRDTVTTADDAQVEAFATLSRSPAHPFVMVSSAIYERIDPADQAVFSRTVITDLLRGRLGFDGVVISDDLGDALAVQAVPAGERAVRFLAAGGTLVLTVDPALLTPMTDAVLARDAVDPEFAATLDAAVRTALLAKARAGLLPPDR